MAYNPANYWQGLLQQANMQQNQANVDRNRADQQRQRSKEEAEREKANQQMVEGFRKIYAASPDLQKAVPISDWGDVSANQVNGLVTGFAQMRQQQTQQMAQQQAQLQQVETMAKLSQQQRQIHEQKLRGQALAGIYGGGAPQQGGAGGMAPGVYVAGQNGMQAIQGGQNMAPPAQQAPGTPQLGPAARYAQNLLASGVSPNNDEIAGALRGSRSAQVLNVDPQNRFIQDGNQNIQRLRGGASSTGGPATSPDGRFYLSDSGWKPIPNSASAQKPLIKMNAWEMQRKLTQQRKLQGEIVEMEEQVSDGNNYKGADWYTAGKKSYTEQILDKEAELADVQQILEAAQPGGMARTLGAPTAPSPTAPAAPTPTGPTGQPTTTTFNTPEEAEASGHKGYAMIAGRPAWIN